MIHSSASSYSSTFWLPGAGGSSSERNHPTSSSTTHDLSGYDQAVESFPGRNDCLRVRDTIESCGLYIKVRRRRLIITCCLIFPRQLLRELNRQVSAYHHLATALGGSSDGQNLRCQLKRTRRRARELASLVKNSLPPG